MRQQEYDNEKTFNPTSDGSSQRTHDVWCVLRLVVWECALSQKQTQNTKN